MYIDDIHRFAKKKETVWRFLCKQYEYTAKMSNASNEQWKRRIKVRNRTTKSMKNHIY